MLWNQIRAKYEGFRRKPAALHFAPQIKIPYTIALLSRQFEISRKTDFIKHPSEALPVFWQHRLFLIV